jgi:hypothetical protein
MLGLGAGVQLGRGPIALDLGYRHKRIMASRAASALNRGNAYNGRSNARCPLRT